MIDQARATALLLPEVTEGPDGFSVAGVPFARVDGAGLALLADGGWTTVPPGLDPAELDDRIARAWELAAPRGLLEAGGR